MIRENGRTFLVVNAIEVQDALAGLTGKAEPWTNAGIAIKRLAGAIAQEEWKKTEGGKMVKTGVVQSGEEALKSLHDGFGKRNPTRQLSFDPKKVAVALEALEPSERKLVSDNLEKAHWRSMDRHAQFMDRRNYGPAARRQALGR